MMLLLLLFAVYVTGIPVTYFALKVVHHMRGIDRSYDDYFEELFWPRCLMWPILLPLYLLNLAAWKTAGVINEKKKSSSKESS